MSRSGTLSLSMSARVGGQSTPGAVTPWASRGLAGLAVLLALGGCAPQTRVTLLPGETGRHSAVAVETEREQATLNAPYAVAEVGRGGRVGVTQTTADQVNIRHPELMTLVPPKAERFVMEFNTGSAELPPAERARMEAVIERARARPGGEIVVTGHTDRQGSVASNDRLALERAMAIRALFIARGFPPERIEAVGRGEREPLVPTADDIAEPRNRRAEILVR